ncbi:methionyl-tRNA formyltransferase [Acutalibacter muris]|uniref:Methionyl-tRNA formyltransferase n=1 Tax=Acutalibacter muris TaxID=1796620 RepID=A0A1Z2XPI6_9FIRM|nr:methionyl-tRNA formyltransferase [Acutalibacter muris]ANU52956.1 methionyl-tRNA formyltransferase [Hungateiclostridiaceae bacterium KB18]ASB40368.1 methionyl-tRNA formyltransferase [Acutalibacter muris]QQR29659.1 methionyl-tRNA formyltransferase [Acutalibacter muris]
MRVIFMGTPDFAVPSLQALLDRGDDICAVFTQPDKPKGRGHKLQPPPVKELALRHSLPVLQPDTLRDEAVQESIAELEPDAIIVVAYGKLLPPKVLSVPRLGCINVHGSLLPKYRGAAPIQWAVINGEKTAGVTTMFMAEGMDTGDMLLKSETEVGPEETSGELFDRLKLLGAKLLTETLDKLEQGELKAIPQDGTQATLAPLLKKEMSALDWSEPAQRIHDRIRGLNPWPCAAADLDGKRVKLLASQVIEGEGVPGTAYNLDGELAAACGRGMLRITELQADTGKRMSGKDYLLGHPLKEGARFE